MEVVRPPPPPPPPPPIFEGRSLPQQKTEEKKQRLVNFCGEAWPVTEIQNVRKWRQFVLVCCGQKNVNKIMPYFEHNQAAFRTYPIRHWTESYTRFSRHCVKSFKVVLKRGRVTTMMILFDLHLTRNFAVCCVSLILLKDLSFFSSRGGGGAVETGWKTLLNFLSPPGNSRKIVDSPSLFVKISCDPPPPLLKPPPPKVCWVCNDVVPTCKGHCPCQLEVWGCCKVPRAEP